MLQVMDNISLYAGKSEEFKHPFFMKVKEYIDNEDIDA
jgi:hypothetical protein